MNDSLPKCWFAWSSGKDCGYALHTLRQEATVDIVGLLTTINEKHDRVAMHAVRHELLEEQARAVGLPLVTVMLPSPCSNEIYEERMAASMETARARGITRIAFGDLFLEDIREYRERKLEGTGIEPIFPLWKRDTGLLAKEMIDSGMRARITCVDPKQLDPSFVGRDWDASFLADLPESVDPCGENGEFHSFLYEGPMFSHPIRIKSGEVVEREGFYFADVLVADER
jgi:uncharacterized protein (TIGR00290 family)